LSNCADIALIKNNARVGSVLAVNLADEMKKHLPYTEPAGTTRPRPTAVQTDTDNEHRCKTACAKVSGKIVSF